MNKKTSRKEDVVDVNIKICFLTKNEIEYIVNVFSPVFPSLTCFALVGNSWQITIKHKESLQRDGSIPCKTWLYHWIQNS